MILLEKIVLKNFLSHTNTEVVFKHNDKLLIDGISGSGKSSIVEALVWALYNKGRSDNRSLVHTLTKYAEVKVYLTSTDKAHYKIERRITSDGKHTLKVYKKEGESYKQVDVIGTKALQDYVEKEIMHSSYLLFVNSVVYPQNNEDSFIKQSASVRKELLLEMANADTLGEYLKKTKILITDKIDTISRLEGRITAANDWINKANYNAGDAKELKTAIDTLNGSIDALTADLESNNVLHKVIQRLEVDVLKYKTEIDSLEATIDRAPKKSPLTEINKLKAQYKKNLDAYKKWEKEHDKIMAAHPVVDYSHLSKDIHDIEEAIRRDKNLGIWSCPECELKTPVSKITGKSHWVEPEKLRDKWKQELKDAETKSASLNVALQALGEKPELPQQDAGITMLEVRLQVFRSLPELKKTLKNTKEKLAYEEAEIAKLQKEHKPDLEANIGHLKVKKERLQGELRLQTERADMIETYKKERKSNQEKLVKEQKELKNLKLLRDAFGPKGITAMVIDQLVPQLEDRVNNILRRLSSFRVKFETQRSGLSGKTILEGLFIDVINDQGQELDFDLYSGGEKLRIIVAISEALSEVQDIGFRILDEAFIGLDNESVYGFVEVIEELRERFSQLICISHLQDIKDEFDSKILITKINGKSKVSDPA